MAALLLALAGAALAAAAAAEDAGTGGPVAAAAAVEAAVRVPLLQQGHGRQLGNQSRPSAGGGAAEVRTELATAAGEATQTGSCSKDDERAAGKLGGGNADGTFPKTVAQCGRDAYSWFSFSKGKMQSCIEEKVSISPLCAQCFADAGQWGYDHCKFQCLFGSWCSGSCLSCTEKNNAETSRCAGVPLPDVQQC